MALLNPATVRPNMLMRSARQLTTAIATHTVALLVAASAGSSHLSAQVISTRAPLNVDHYVVGGWGLFGQSFVAPEGVTSLVDFTFWVREITAAEPYSYRALVYAFDGAHPVGAPLYASGYQAADGPTAVVARTFITGGVDVSAGEKYIAVVQRSSPYGMAVGYAGPGDLYDGGVLYVPQNFWTSDATDPELEWIPAFRPGNDLSFVANFSAVSTVPEPATFSLFAVGLTVVGASAARCRRGCSPTGVREVHPSGHG